MAITKKIFFLVLLVICIAGSGLAQYPLAGMTPLGGKYGGGVIFTTDIKSKLVAEHSFVILNEGSNPEGSLIEASNGKYYGMTSYGGKYGGGVIFEYDPSAASYIIKYSFNYLDGKVPKGSLMEASNGKLYGMTTGGGNNHSGILFEYDPLSETLNKKFDFNGSNGREPTGSLIQGTNGKLYGLTTKGGKNDKGVLFEFDLSTGSLTKKFDFSTVYGTEPNGSLMQASNGKLYGMTVTGGKNNEGVVFEFDTDSNTLTKKFDFGGINGSSPYGSLIEVSKGKLYGMTFGGGTINPGVLFEYDFILNVYEKKLDFNFIDGGNPRGSLLLASNGKLYGLAAESTGTGGGVIFEFDLSSERYSKKFGFSENTGNTPYGSLIEASNGKLYGLTSLGGAGAAGTLFEYDPHVENYTDKVNFNFAIDGRTPWGSLALAANGKLYGMTRDGGINNKGVLFEFDPSTGVYTKKIDFNGTNGSSPYGSLIPGYNGNLYGMTISGGANGAGTIFEYNPYTGAYDRKHDFDHEAYFPKGKLMQASNGKLYGMTNQGGLNSLGGILFEFDPFSGDFSKKFDFGGTNGCFPEGAVIEANNGKLYGMTPFLGSENFYNYGGILFEYDILTDNFTKKIDFNYETLNGITPRGSLVQAFNNKLYGMTSMGGKYGGGVLFEYDPSSAAYNKKFDFDINQSSPEGSLFKAMNNKLYGMTLFGGINKMGVLFEFDPATGKYKKLFDFNGENGMSPRGDLIQLCNLPEAAGKITGDRTVCRGEQEVVYSVPAISNANGYNWILPPGATITSGHNTNSVTVDFNHNVRIGNIYVVGTNECGYGIISPNLEILSLNCSEIASNNTNLSVAIMPNPNNGVFKIEIKLKKKENLTVKLFDMHGKVVFSEQSDQVSGKWEKIIDIVKESQGVYHLQVISSTQTANKKVVLNK